MSGARLFHVGVAPDEVTERAILVEQGIDPASLVAGATLVAERREYRSYRALDAGGPLLVLTAGLGSPPLAIAMEELSRAGCRRMAVLSRCRCGDCEAAGHSLLVVQAAVRREGTTVAYAPAGFPAVPDPDLLERAAARHGYSALATTVTVDVSPAGPEQDGTPVDLWSATAFVVGAARGLATIAFLLGSGEAVPGRLGAAVATVLAEGSDG